MNENVLKEEIVMLENQIRILQQKNQELKIQVSAREEVSNKYKEVIDKTKDKLYCWGEALDPEFQKIMLDILKEVE